MAAKRKPDLVACTACDMYGTTEQFTDESCDTCKNCERLRCSEGKVRVLEEKIETVRRSFEILEMPKSALESGAGSTDHAGATQRKNGRSQDQPKEEKPVEEEQIPKKELLDMIDKAIASGQYFFIGIFPVNKETGMAKDALYECEGRTVDQMGAFTSSNHPIDKIAKDKMQLQLIKTFYTEELKLKNALERYNTLKSNYFGESLRIKDDVKHSTVDTEKAIVYLRIYCRLN